MSFEEQHSSSPTTLSSTIKPSYLAVGKRPEQDLAEHGPRRPRQGSSHGTRKSLNRVKAVGGPYGVRLRVEAELREHPQSSWCGRFPNLNSGD